MRDPMEEKVEELLSLLGIKFVREADDKDGNHGLDFRCGSVFIEAKQFHSDRSAKQLTQADNVILFQGKPSVQVLIDAIKRLKLSAVA